MKPIYRSPGRRTVYATPADLERHAAKMRERNAARPRKRAKSRSEKLPEAHVREGRPTCPACETGAPWRTGETKIGRARFKCRKCKLRFYGPRVARSAGVNRDLFDARMRTVGDLIALEYGDWPGRKVNALYEAALRHQRALRLMIAWRERRLAA